MFKSKKELKNIKILNIEFSEVLLTPTVMGKSTKGNNFDGEKFYKISNKNVGRFEKRISKDNKNY